MASTEKQEKFLASIDKKGYHVGGEKISQNHRFVQNAKGSFQKGLTLMEGTQTKQKSGFKSGTSPMEEGRKEGPAYKVPGTRAAKPLQVVAKKAAKAKVSAAVARSKKLTGVPARVAKMAAMKKGKAIITASKKKVAKKK